MITYNDGRPELKVLHTGPPCRTEDTIDCCRFSREPDATSARTMWVSNRDLVLQRQEAGH